MKDPKAMFFTRCDQHGVALVIVLAFVVLLTGLSVAYLSRSLTDRQIAKSSSSDSVADDLARSSLDFVVGDLQQEISLTSTYTNYGNGFELYSPNSATNNVPIRSGTPSSGQTPIPNLVRISSASDINLPVRSLASAISTSTPSANDRSISAARWNAHYLIPKLNTGDTQSDPVTSFKVPDWILVTRNGPASETTIGSGNTALNNPLRTNQNYVTGRYAYSIFDEGGLLDLNVAGFPYPVPAATPSSLLANIGRKGTIAFADLTAIRLTTGTTTPSPTTLNWMVAWRNFATLKSSGTYPTLSPTPDPAASDFVKYALDATRDARKVASTVYENPPGTKRTDQAYVSRKGLIELVRTSTGLFNMLPSVSTFSRAINTPSYSPASPDATNPDFRKIRVTNSFTRFDGSTAKVGEPLVKKPFPLDRLSWITYKGPSASLAVTDPVIVALLNSGVPLTTIQQGTAANIQSCFGLTYVPSALWTYSHGLAGGIMTLGAIATAGREPDFFELLKATVKAGSLGQNTNGGTTPTGSTVFPDLHMSDVTHHLLSIGASAIDQADLDSVPTRIQYDHGGGAFWIAYGIEDLPYVNQVYPIAGISPDDPNQATPTLWATYLLVQLWNPHKQPGTAPTRPNIRLRLDGDVALVGGFPTPPPYTPGSAPKLTGTGQVITVDPNGFINPTPLLNDGSSTFGSLNNCSPAAPYSRLPSAGPPDLSNYVGIRLPDYTMAASTSAPSLYVVYGADSTHRFNLCLEVEVTPGTYVPYNHFIGINNSASWIGLAETFVRKASSSSGKPSTTNDKFTTSRLTSNSSPPANFMKADPRSTRFGIFQVDNNPTTTKGRIDQALWPTNFATVPNGYGGDILDPGGPVEHAPMRFSGSPYFAGTLCINTSPSTTTRTAYADPDAIIRAADAAYPDTSVATLGSSTPYFTTSTDYHPIMLNRPLRSVGELGYLFRDLPWKTLDFFTDQSADAGLLDVFSVGDEPDVVVGHVSLNTMLPSALQAALAGASWDELDVTKTISGSLSDNSATAAQTIAANLITATSGSPFLNRSELITRAGIPLTILPLPPNGTAGHNQTVKTRREAIVRALASVTQTRTWNLMIDLIAQSGRYPPNAADLKDFVVEAEKRYWLHIAVDRLTGQIVDQRLESVQE